MQVIKYPLIENWDTIVQRPVQSLDAIEQAVIPILQDVRLRGDTALRYYAEKFDNVQINEILVSKEEVEYALKNVSEELKNAIDVAYFNIFKFHQHQQTSSDRFSHLYNPYPSVRITNILFPDILYKRC